MIQNTIEISETNNHANTRYTGEEYEEVIRRNTMKKIKKIDVLDTSWEPELRDKINSLIEVVEAQQKEIEELKEQIGEYYSDCMYQIEKLKPAPVLSFHPSDCPCNSCNPQRLRGQIRAIIGLHEQGCDGLDSMVITDRILSFLKGKV